MQSAGEASKNLAHGLADSEPVSVSLFGYLNHFASAK